MPIEQIERFLEGRQEEVAKELVGESEASAVV